MLHIEFLSSEVLAPMSEKEKIKFILKNIKNNRILVLDESLSPQEQRTLIAETMKGVGDKFAGIEISTLGDGRNELRNLIIKLLGGRTGLTVIGPSKLVKEIKKNPKKIQLLARER